VKKHRKFIASESSKSTLTSSLRLASKTNIMGR
jgi:hypothetical protein